MKASTDQRRQAIVRVQKRPLLPLLLTALLFLYGCGDKAPPGDARLQRPPVSGVTLATVLQTEADNLHEATGIVKAARVSVIAARTMGTVTSLLVREGDPVEEGQLLLTIDEGDAVQREKGAEAGHREAKKALAVAGQNRELTGITHERYRKMYEKKAISRQEMDQFDSQNRVAGLEYERVQESVGRAEAALAEARIHRGYARVASPVRGRVTEKRTDVGSMAVPGLPLLTVESVTGFQAEFSVDEGLLGRIKVGLPVQVTIESLKRQTTEKITEILPTVDPLSRSFTVKVSLEGPGLRTGLYAKVSIPKEKTKVLLAPKSAIVEKGQLTGVYAVDDKGIITYRLVRTGREHGGGVDILSGLKPDDRIIVGGVEKAVDGGVLEKGK